MAALSHDDDVAVVLMGSWGRAEVTAGSDDDFMILVRGAERKDVRPSIEDVKTVLDRAPGDQGIFGMPVASEQLIKKKRYLDESVKPYRPPRFLLNDVIRYWRTMCVDFAGKEHEVPEKWGLRNAKLRTFRKGLFAGGRLPVFECANFATEEMPDFLQAQMTMPPTDRIAGAFLNHGARDAGGRALGAYDDFLGLLNDDTFRADLTALTRETAKGSTAFDEAARLGRELEQGLLALLFETDSLSKLARDYVVF